MRSIRALITSFVLVAACFGLSAQQNDSATPSQQVNSTKQAKKQHSKKHQPAVLQEPNCPYGYYSYAPYNCAPQGFYGSSWFVNGRFTGAGPWYHNLSDIPQTAQAQATPDYPQSDPNYPQSAASYPAPPPTAQQQATIEEPQCPYGYYSYAPYNCAPPGFYSPAWFVNGQFIGAGPWYRNVVVAQPTWEEPVMVPPTSCQWGYYPSYPYGCAPYGYYGPQWFVGGIFIGAGPWYGWGWGHGWGFGHGWGWGHGYGGRGYRGHSYGGGYGRGSRTNYGGFSSGRGRSGISAPAHFGRR